MTGHIFNIQKFCLHVGPGIRTTVFFKGCPLRCSWCANPESQLRDVQLTYDKDKCSRCGRCASVCPANARSLENSSLHLNEGLCRVCGACIAECPNQAIAAEGRTVSVDEVLSEVMKDKAFYDHSGGGVTFSGGEPLMQMEFVCALAHALRSEGVSVAVETTGAVKPEAFASFLPLADFVYMDLKHYDNAKHIAGTGAGNGAVLANMAALKRRGIACMIRIPVIPGYNDANEDAIGFAKLLRSLNINQVQLLPFHQFGERKYSLLGKGYAYSGVKQLHREDLVSYRQIFLNNGIHAEF